MTKIKKGLILLLTGTFFLTGCSSPIDLSGIKEEPAGSFSSYMELRDKEKKVDDHPIVLGKMLYQALGQYVSVVQECIKGGAVAYEERDESNLLTLYQNYEKNIKDSKINFAYSEAIQVRNADVFLNKMEAAGFSQFKEFWKNSYEEEYIDRGLIFSKMGDEEEPELDVRIEDSMTSVSPVFEKYEKQMGENCPLALFCQSTGGYLQEYRLKTSGAAKNSDHMVGAVLLMKDEKVLQMKIYWWNKDQTVPDDKKVPLTEEEKQALHPFLANLTGAEKEIDGFWDKMQADSHNCGELGTASWTLGISEDWEDEKNTAEFYTIDVK